MRIWPKINLSYNNYKIKKKIDYIEDFFFSSTGFRPILFPSARSCLSIIFKYFKFNRSKNIFINKWSPFCIQSLVTYYSNITTNISDSHLIFLNHRYGKSQFLKKNYKNKIIIEDSADSIHLDKKSFFTNSNSKFEVVSLPKIISSYSGGLIYTKDKIFYNFAKGFQKKNKFLGILQSRKKVNSFKKQKNDNSWLFDEFNNTYLDQKSLNNIIFNLKNFEINKKILINRRKIIEKTFNLKPNYTSKIGPVYIFPKKNFSTKRKLPIYHIHSKKFIEIQKFKKSILLPIHFSIKEDEFKRGLLSLKKIK